MKQKIIIATSILIILSCVYGIYGNYYFIVPFDLVNSNLPPIIQFYALCIIGLIIGFCILSFGIYMHTKASQNKLIEKYEKKLNSLGAYKLNYFKLKKKLNKS